VDSTPIPYELRLDRALRGRDEAAKLERQLARILLETGEAAPATVFCATLAGDSSRLRGLPAIGRGVGGVIPGTQPERALLAKERQRR
jgi:hypothetical protein